jgi:hypothetical protein
MSGPLLNDVYKYRAELHTPSELLEPAMLRYGEIKTFFTKYKNPIGIELEVENVHGAMVDVMQTMPLYWYHKPDESLKVKGAEFVSKPISGQNIDYAIHEMATLTEDQNFLYSVRTSTHVHMNVCFLTERQFRLLICLSALFEPLLWQLCKEERKTNPFCYSITHLTPKEVFSYNENLKYCGINPAPVSKFVTLEYRYLHGTNDWKLLRRWIQLLCKMYFFVKMNEEKEVENQIIHACQGSSLDLIKTVFGASAILFENPHAIDEGHRLWTVAGISLLGV